MQIKILTDEKSDGCHYLEVAVSTPTSTTIVEINYMADLGLVNVCQQNSIHRSLRGTGRVFDSWEDAITDYKSHKIRAAIQAAQKIAAPHKKVVALPEAGNVLKDKAAEIRTGLKDLGFKRAQIRVRCSAADVEVICVTPEASTEAIRAFVMTYNDNPFAPVSWRCHKDAPTGLGTTKGQSKDVKVTYMAAWLSDRKHSSLRGAES